MAHKLQSDMGSQATSMEAKDHISSSSRVLRPIQSISRPVKYDDYSIVSPRRNNKRSQANESSKSSSQVSFRSDSSASLSEYEPSQEEIAVNKKQKLSKPAGILKSSLVPKRNANNNIHTRNKKGITIVHVVTQAKPKIIQNDTSLDSNAKSKIKNASEVQNKATSTPLPAIPTGKVLTVDSTELLLVPNFELPESVSDHFTYVGHKFTGGKRKAIFWKGKSPDGRNCSKSYQNRCIHCQELVCGHVSSDSNLRFHLETHQIHIIGESLKVNIPVINDRGEVVTDADIIGYAHNHPKQLLFSNLLLDFIVSAKLPFAVVEDYGFRRLCLNLDSQLVVPSRFCIRNLLRSSIQTKVIPNLKSQLENGSAGSLLIDGWTSRKRHGILAIRFVFFTEAGEWKIKTLAVQRLIGQHTAVNIRDVVKQEFNIVNKVCFVCTDNASNMIAAFRNLVNEFVYVKADKETAEGSTLTSSDQTYDDMFALLNSGIVSEFCEEIEHNLMEAIDEFVNGEYLKQIFVSSPKFWQVTCASHSLQICVNNAIKKTNANEIIRRKNEIISYVTNHLQDLERLRSSTGKGLICSSPTRWNYEIDSCESFIDVFETLQAIISDNRAKLVNRSKDLGKMPLPLNDSFKYELKAFLQVAKPFAEATDILQKDEVTAHLVIPTLVEAYHSVDKMGHMGDLEAFRIALLTEIQTKFKPWMKDAAYIIPTVLNPLCKLHWFDYFMNEQGRFHNPLDVPSSAFARDIVVCHMIPLGSSKQSTHEKPEQYDKIKKPLWMVAMEKKQQSSILSSVDENLDIIHYLESPQVELPILDYWNTEGRKYKSILPLVFMFLSNPASTAAVERLFSFIGKQNRQDRANLAPATLEELALYFEYLDFPNKLQNKKPVIKRKSDVKHKSALAPNLDDSNSDKDIKDNENVEINISNVDQESLAEIRKQLDDFSVIH